MSTAKMKLIIDEKQDATEVATAEYIIASLIDSAGSKDNLLRVLQESVSDAFALAIDDDETVDDLESCELSFIGTRSAKNMLKRLSLPRFSTHRKKTLTERQELLLDTIVNGISMDVKFTMADSWMIPEKIIGNWCLLIQADRYTLETKIGIVKTNIRRVRASRNQDKKTSLNAFGRNAIFWID
jgi:hypothetical protein